jgi:hypothetical protein
MFIVFDGQAEFTIDGRTSVLLEPLSARSDGPLSCHLQSSDKPVEFMNINIASIKGHYDASLTRPMLGSALPKTRSVFMTMNLTKQYDPQQNIMAVRNETLSAR